MFPLFRQHAQPVVGEEVLQQRGVIAAGFDGRIELWVVLHAGDAAAERVAPVEVAFSAGASFGGAGLMWLR